MHTYFFGTYLPLSKIYKHHNIFYNLNEYFNTLVSVVYKNLQVIKNSKKGYVIENKYYKDIECSFDTNFLLSKVVLYSRFHVERCHHLKNTSKQKHGAKKQKIYDNF